MFNKMATVLLCILMTSSLFAIEHRSIRATDLNDKVMSKIKTGEIQNVIIEFREHDRLPVNIEAEGDLFQSVDNIPTFVEIKKNFFIKLSDNKLTMSFDGETFRPIKELIGGSLSATASSDTPNEPSSPANGINIIFNTFLK